VLTGDAVYGVLEGHEDDPGPSMLALRLMGAVHRLVLRGDAPALAAHYPSASGRPGDGAWPTFAELLRDRRDELRVLVEHPVQTNEPGRCAALLGGFLEVARRTGLPLRLLEVGASAGLNLRFDRYRYELGDERWGPADSQVAIRARLTGGRPPLDVSPPVASRAGCDPRPVDPHSEEGRLTLTSYVWADQMERLERLRTALALAAEDDVAVECAGAADWTEARLAEPAPGVATVVFHSIVLQYLPAAERERFERAMRAPPGPLARLLMEPAGDLAEVRLTLWPGGEERLLARAGYHGDVVEWLG
jgi:hypothetical protein